MGNPTSYNDDPTNPSYTEQPSKLDMALALFQRTGSSEGVGSVHGLTVRIPTIEYCSIEALAKHSGLSRNKVIVELLGVALDEVWQGLNPDDRHDLVRIRSEVLDTILRSPMEQAGKGDI